VFFARSLKDLGVRQEVSVRVIEHLRRQYPVLLSERPERLRVQFGPRSGKGLGGIWPELVFDTRRLWECLAVAIAAKDELAQIQRGRPKKDWRAMFREAMVELSKEMQEKHISEEQIDAALEAVRARRRQKKVGESVVTVPPP
jgi:hypothetical protein